MVARFSFGASLASRFRAASLYLSATCVVATAIFVPIYFLWYPGALFDQAGGRELFLLITGVDLTIGPLVVFVVFVPGKKGLAFDLATIAVLQLSALAYGVWVLFESRPAFIVFVKDRFELVRANQISDKELDKAQSGPNGGLSWSGPRVVGARLPKDPDEQFRFMMSAMGGGADIQGYPQYYVAYDDVKGQVLSQSAALARLRELNPGSKAEIDALVAQLGRPEAQLRFLPMRAGPYVDLTVLVDAASGKVLKYAALRPWEYK